MPRISLADVSYLHSDGTPAFSSISATLSGRVGLVGLNGSGKTTLLRLMAGELSPSSGSIDRTDAPRHVPQNPALNATATLADLMGIGEKASAMRAIRTGAVEAADLAALDDDWDFEERAGDALREFGVADGGGDILELLERPVGRLSGGEAMAAALAGAFMREPSILLLDEPTNNLDYPARRRLCDIVGRWRGCLVVVSHDAELLERMEAIAELRGGSLKIYGCPFSGYLELSRAEKEVADRRAGEAATRLKEEKRRSSSDRTRAERSRKQGERAGLRSRFPTAAIHLRRSRAEKSAARQRELREERLERAGAALRDAKAVAREEERISVELPETEMPAGKVALEIESAGRVFSVRGPERIALRGRNGSGKTTLIRAVMGRAAVPGMSVLRVVPETGCLPQRLDEFDDSESALANLRRYAPALTVNEAHAELARFLLKGDRAGQAVGTLSGGERLRLGLACLLSVRPAPRLVLLDEPTNNLDRQSVAELVEAMNRFRGAIVAVSHDETFLRLIGAERGWTMAGMRLTE